MQHFSVRERLGVAAAAGIVLMLGLGGWAYSHAGGDGAAKPAFAPVGANGAPASVEIAAGGSAASSASGRSGAVSVAAAPAAPSVLVVHVTGEVRNPGVYKFKDGDRIADAIHAAGGFKDHADQEAINLADTLRDADQICVPLLVKITGPDLSPADRMAGAYTAQPAPHRRHPLIVSGNSPAVNQSVQPPVDSTTAGVPSAADDTPVPTPAAPRLTGRVLGRPTPDPALSDVTGDETAADPGAAPVDDPIAADTPVVRLSVGKKGRGTRASVSKAGRSAGKSAKFKNPGDGIVHINSATAPQFEQLPGVGPAMSGRIIEYRAQIGKFTDVSQMMDVKGIGEKKFAKMQPFLAL